MRLLALAVLCLSSSLVNAYPVTYNFTGQLTLAEMSVSNYETGEWNVYNDPSNPLIVNGQTLLNGSTVMTGSITIDHEIYVDPPVLTGTEWLGGQVLDWQMSFGGVTFYPQWPGSTHFEAMVYQPGRAGMFDEVPRTSNSLLPDVGWMNFFFTPETFADSLPGTLPVDAFLNGDFRFTGISTDGGAEGPEFTRGNIFGTITSLSVAEVPEPGTIGLLAAGLLGLACTRRRAS